ncbi:MAG: ferritin family protein [Bacteroidota bacterium]
METNKTIDILKMAILMEKRGFAFYSKVAENTADPEIRHIFLVMADEETKHVKFLTDQFLNVEKEHKFAYVNLGDLMHEEFANLILSEELKQKISAAGFEAAAISAAIDFEKRAVEVYSTQAAKTDDPNEKALFQWLADWEKGHLKILNDIDNELKERIWNDNQFWPF